MRDDEDNTRHGACASTQRKDNAEKYIRELHIMARQLSNLIDAAQSDPGLTREQREDITFATAKLRESLADGIANLITSCYAIHHDN